MSSYIKLDMPTNTVQFKRVHKVTYRQHNYEHDYARVYLRDWGISPKQAKPGTPINIDIQGKSFYGYIHDIKNFQEMDKNFTEVGIIGASYVMRQGSQATYKNVTADQVIVSIAKKYNFAYKVTPHPRVYPQLSQAGQTDWEFMVKLAKQSGYFLKAENTTLYFQPLDQEFKEKLMESARFSKNDAGFKSLQPMYSFTPIVGETLAHNGADKSAISIAGVNPKTGKYFKYTKQKRSPVTRAISNPELFDKHDTGVVANDYTTAVQEAKSADEKSKFPYQAEAEVIGASRVSPGHPVYLEGVGKEYSGYWTVLRVEHKIIEESLNVQRFTTILTIGTDSLGTISDQTQPSTPPARAIRKIVPNVRNTRIKAGTVLNKTGAQVKPSGPLSLVSRANRANVKDKSARSNVWVSTHGNLNTKTITASRSTAAILKAGKNVARK